MIAPSSSKVRITSTPSLTRESGLVFFQSMPCIASSPKLPLESTTSARPSDSSSRVAAACAISVGSRSTTPETLGPIRMFVVSAAAAAKSSQRSFHQVSSAAYTAWYPSSSANLMVASDSLSGYVGTIT